MRERLLERLAERMRSYEDLVIALPEPALAADLPVPSNRVGAQLWCVVGARESYARALAAGQWSGFACSLAAERTRRRDAVLAALRTSAGDVLAATRTVRWTPERDDLLLDLVEHEAQHQGQLIRYVYGLGHAFPRSWQERWALT